jgi:ATP/maltotriose-dependent transcriptional regulator MalT
MSRVLQPAGSRFVSRRGAATVKTHLAHVYDKLGVDSRTSAVRVAVERRLIRLT